MMEIYVSRKLYDILTDDRINLICQRIAKGRRFKRYDLEGSGNVVVLVLCVPIKSQHYATITLDVFVWAVGLGVI